MRGHEIGYLDLLQIKTKEKIKQEAAEKKASPLRPSSAGTCTRSLAYQMAEYLGHDPYSDEVFTPEVYRLLSLGSSIEYHVIRSLECMKPTFEVRYKQQTLSLGKVTSLTDPTLVQRIEGSIDLVLWSEKSRCVVDVKSKKDWGLGKTHWVKTTEKLKQMASVQTISEVSFWVEDLVEFLKELKDPFFEANFLQLNMYAQSEFLKERGVDHAAIFQYNKNTSAMREIRFKPSTSLYEQVLNKFQIALDAGVRGCPQSAPRDYEKGSIVCRYCRYEAVCKTVPVHDVAHSKSKGEEDEQGTRNQVESIKRRRK